MRYQETGLDKMKGKRIPDNIRRILDKNPPIKDTSTIKSLVDGIARGDTDARNKLSLSCARYVYREASSIVVPNVSMEDLFNEGIMSVMNSAEKYNFSEDVHFLSYARVGIRRRLIAATSDLSRVVRIPGGPATSTVHRARMKSSRGIALTREEEDAIEVGSPHANIDDISELYVDADQDETANISQIRDHILEELRRIFRPRTAYILDEHFGLSKGYQRTLQEIGDELGISRARVGYIVKGSLEVLQDSEILKKFFNECE